MYNYMQIMWIYEKNKQSMWMYEYKCRSSIACI